MLFELFKTDVWSSASNRRKKLAALVKDTFLVTKGKILLIGGLERPHQTFLQESNFYYLTGLLQAGCVAVIDLNGYSTLFVPTYNYDRTKWLKCTLEPQPHNIVQFHFDEMKLLGNTLKSADLNLLFDKHECQDLIAYLADVLQKDEKVFTFYQPMNGALVDQYIFINRLAEFLPSLKNNLVDISSLVAHMRRSKGAEEIELLHQAAHIGIAAQEAAAETIAPGEKESVVQASLEWIMTASHARPSFSSIVASGENATILHYHQNDGQMNAGDLVIVDIGARVEGYCSDITRTYPVSGSFSKRQREIYNIVLEVQHHIEDIAKPGFWLSNAHMPEQSLNHQARKVLTHYGLDRFFIHNIGHFLGLDVHDVGDVSKPLQEGDVITIEPGLYMPEERIGIRIEDDYWLAGGGLVCLSDGLAKKDEEVEALMKRAKGR